MKSGEPSGVSRRVMSVSETRGVRRLTPRLGSCAMLEIELKFPVAEFSAIQQRLGQWGARAEAALDEADHYFNAPDRDFARTDEAFRLRRIGTQNRITYKGPKQGGPAKTRTEIELGLEAGAESAD